MLVRLDPSLPTPLFQQLAASIRAQIAAGDLTPGDRLPGARELAASLDVNVHTVLRGYGVLRDEGLLEVRRSRGAVVTGQASRVAGSDLAALTTAVEEVRDAARRLGLSLDELLDLIRKGYQT